MGYIDKESLLASYIFDAQWQTIEEFRANPVEGWCHISYSDRKNIDIAYYEDEGFYFNDMHNNTDNWNDVNITHVMPIKTPGVPK